LQQGLPLARAAEDIARVAILANLRGVARESAPKQLSDASATAAAFAPLNHGSGNSRRQSLQYFSSKTPSASISFGV
jgi:hypothetical protein